VTVPLLMRVVLEVFDDFGVRRIYARVPYGVAAKGAWRGYG
jgi:hypothetical protein